MAPLKNRKFLNIAKNTRLLLANSQSHHVPKDAE
jgi:hypothetical protein